MERNGTSRLPVVSAEGLPVGALRLHELMQEVGKERSADLSRATTASKDGTVRARVGLPGSASAVCISSGCILDMS